MAISSVERPPGLPAPWLDVWRGALKAMKEHGTWAPAMRPLLDEYVFALRAASDAREGFAGLDRLEDAAASEEIDWVALRQVATGLPVQWDRHVKRAAALADQLGLTLRGRMAAGSTANMAAATDPFAKLDELSQRRRKRP